MIVAHFFIRNVRRKPYLFVETTSSDGIEQPAPAAQMLMAVDANDKRQKWVRDAYYEFVKRYPDLVLLDSMNNALRLESDHPSFDMVFKPKSRTRKEAGDGKEAKPETSEKPEKTEEKTDKKKSKQDSGK